MRRFIRLSFLLAIMLVINFFVRKKLPYAYADMISYNQLYYPAGHMRITGLSVTRGDSLKIIFKGLTITNNNFFEVSCNNQVIIKKQAPALTIKPQPGLTTLLVRINNAIEQLQINIDYTPRDIYSREGTPGNMLYEVTSHDLPITTNHLSAIEKWQVPDLTNISIEKTTTYLRDSMHINHNDSSSVTASKIAAFILKKTHLKAGRPSDSLSLLDPIEQLNFVHDGKSKIWCGNFSYLFSFFASRAGLHVRVVNCGGGMDNVSIGDHSFNEVYLPEFQCWAYVDLTAQNVFVKKGNAFLNSVEIQRYLRHEDETRDLTAYHFDGDSIRLVPFADADSLAVYYFHPGNYFYFFYGDYLRNKIPANTFARMLKFFYTTPNEAIYSDNLNEGNEQFYMRIASNYLLLLVFILWLITAASLLRSKRRQHAATK